MSSNNIGGNYPLHTDDQLMGNPNSFNDQNTFNMLQGDPNNQPLGQNLHGSPAAHPPLSQSPIRQGSPDPRLAGIAVPQQPIQNQAVQQQPVQQLQNQIEDNFSKKFQPPTLQKSELFTSNDRFDLEQDIMKPLKAGGGPLGITRIVLDEKLNLLALDQKKTLTNDAMLEKLRIDGVYVDDPQVHQKFTDINVQKLEERVLREMPFFNGVEAKLMADGKKTKYFKMNGEIKLNNDLLADEITRPADIAFEQTEAFQTKEVNSILCNRLHSFKKRYYRLDIVVGKICLHNYPQFFHKEDKLAIELREMYKEYEKRTSLAMIPFYMDRVKFIEKEQYMKQRNPLTPKEELEFLQQNVEESQRKLDQEKREVQELAQKLYTKWKQIKEIRENQMFASTNVKMKVHKNEETGEFYFNLMHEEPSGKLDRGKNSGSALPSSEVSRRNSAMNIRAYVRLKINGKYVSSTKKAKLSWPNFEIEVSELFQVCMFTMPSSIQLEIIIGTFKEYLVDVIDIEVPGKYVKALTSASQLVKEINFSKFSYERKKLQKKFSDESKKPEGVLSEAQKKKLEEAQKKKELEELKAIENDIKGIIYIKSEWKGEGPEMPPMRSENIFKQTQPQKNRKTYTEDEQHRMLLRQLYIDVNDPRNERIIKFIKETKNEFLIKLLQEDAKNPLAHLKPFRHMLLEARAKDPDFSKEKIPLLESEIILNKTLLDKLEVLYREQAYKEYLEKKADEERQGIGKKQSDSQKVYMLQLEDNAIKYDSEVIRRRQIIFDQLKQYQREVKAGHQKASTQYKSIVREFELLESENPLIALFNKMFITGRKLKPVVQKRQPVSYDSCKEATIMVHIIKGFNVPIRNSSKQEILSKFTTGRQAAIQDPYSRSGAGPFPISQRQYGNTMGIMQSQNDFRQSMGRSGFQQDDMMMRTQQNRMMIGVPLDVNNPNQLGPVTKGDIRQLSEDQLRSLYRTARVEAMVQVRIVYNEDFQEVKITNIAEGDFPEWNEILEFNLKTFTGKKFIKEELVNTKSMIYITLFDRETVFKNAGSVQVEQQFRYLGSISIPLIAILHNPPKMDAILKVNRPLVLSNYQIETNSLFFLNQAGVQQPVKVEIPNTYLSLSVSLDPVIEIPQDNEFEYYPGREGSALLIALTEWCKRLKKGKMEKRNIRTIGENICGQSVLICRFLTPQAPPNEIYDYSHNKNDPYAIERAARYVSLIPFLEDCQAFNDFPDLYCTSQEFLDLGAGDFEEHAILLCNYFNFIDQHQNKEKRKSYVVLGIGNPEGRTAYVMRQDETTNHVELWNPLKGEAQFFGREEIKQMVGCIPISKGFKMDRQMNNSICQLKGIGCIIGGDNIWANIQEFEDPTLLTFDLKNTKAWKPFFNKVNKKKYFPNEIIRHDQPDYLSYMRKMDSQRAEVIALKIQNYITERFENERISKNQMRTKWNNSIESILRDILIKLEIMKLKQRQGSLNSTLMDPEVKKVSEDFNNYVNQVQVNINQVAGGQRAWGFPLNVTFISLPMLWEDVRNTEIHLTQDDDAEFALYVYVEPYPHNVLSVWIYILALTKNKTGYLPY